MPRDEDVSAGMSGRGSSAGGGDGQTKSSPRNVGGGRAGAVGKKGVGGGFDPDSFIDNPDRIERLRKFNELQNMPALQRLGGLFVSGGIMNEITIALDAARVMTPRELETSFPDTYGPVKDDPFREGDKKGVLPIGKIKPEIDVPNIGSFDAILADILKSKPSTSLLATPEFEDLKKKLDEFTGKATK